jgi:hypothetical protein
VSELNRAIRRISGVAEGNFCNDAEKLTGRFLAELQFSTVDEIFDRGLHQYLDEAQTKLNDIGAALFQSYISQPFQNPDGEHMVQQEEQQQQQSAERRANRSSTGVSPVCLRTTRSISQNNLTGETPVPL